jgi:hypothetical protein
MFLSFCLKSLMRYSHKLAALLSMAHLAAAAMQCAFWRTLIVGFTASTAISTQLHAQRS